MDRKCQIKSRVLKQQCYHWRDLPQVSFLSRQSFFFFVSTNSCLSRLSRQTRVRLDKTRPFDATKVYLLRKKFEKQIFWRDKLTFVATITCLSRQNTSFITTKVYLSRQTFSLDKRFVAANTCLSRYFFVLSRQKCYLWQLPPRIVRGTYVLNINNS